MTYVVERLERGPNCEVRIIGTTLVVPQKGKGFVQVASNEALAYTQAFSWDVQEGVKQLYTYEVINVKHINRRIDEDAVVVDDEHPTWRLPGYRPLREPIE